MPRFRFGRRLFPLLILSLLSAGSFYGQTASKPLTFSDAMKFNRIADPVISSDGRWVAYGLQPDRGDGEVQIRATDGTQSYSLKRGGRPVFSKDGRRLGALVNIRAVDMDKPAKDRPKTGMAYLDLTTGKMEAFESVEEFAFSDDGRWLAIGFFRPEEKPAPAGPPAEGEAKKEEPPAWDAGRLVLLRNLESGEEFKLEDVLSFSFDPKSTVLAVVLSAADGRKNGLAVRDLKRSGIPETVLYLKEKASFAAPVWAKDSTKMALTAAVKKNKEDPGRASLVLWEYVFGSDSADEAASAAPAGWILPLKSPLEWSADGKRLYLGLRPESELPKPAAPAAVDAAPAAADFFDIPAILEKRAVDVWHGSDPLIIPHQKKEWERNKDRTYTAVFYPDKKRTVLLASPDMRGFRIPDNPDVALGWDGRPYQKEITWDGEYADVYLVSLSNGERRKILTRFGSRPFLSPGGKYVAYFQDKHWLLLEVKTGLVRNLTQDLPVAFYEEDDDHPAPPPAYGDPFWMENDAAVLLPDRHDIWVFPTGPKGSPADMTAGEGRRENRSFRIVLPDPEQKFIRKSERLLLASTHLRDKNRGFYEAIAGTSGVTRLLEDRKNFTFKARAKDSGTILFTREDYREFPDLWTTDAAFGPARKISEANPQISEFAWGEAELVEWTSDDGRPLQGVLIKPGGYEPGRRYPVLVYYYEISSDRLYDFNEIVVNHRPCFPVYAGHGYAVFLPDIRFTVGRPGMSAVHCLVPGVRKLIDMGLADPKAVGLHGHSWGGYETAFVVTRTDLFAAACAGAPVGNMTSAYSGIRWESGMARQFQYEREQSRIGASLWEARDLYVENSPVFFADRIKTPLLLMHGDEDGAVPWYQSIELYLALRRLGKDCFFLQYRGEPHHPKTYANKLDYSIKMMEFFDHYLKGAPAADWIKTGVPYNGK